MADLIPVPEAGRTAYLRADSISIIRPGTQPQTCVAVLTNGFMAHLECSADDLRSRVEGRPTAYAKPLPTTPAMGGPYRVGEAGPTVHQG